MDKKQSAINALQEKQKLLGRTPKKEDFDDVSVSKIKGVLGPWPRALEAAGLKTAKKKQCKKRSTNRQATKEE